MAAVVKTLNSGAVFCWHVMLMVFSATALFWLYCVGFSGTNTKIVSAVVFQGAKDGYVVFLKHHRLYGYVPLGVRYEAPNSWYALKAIHFDKNGLAEAYSSVELHNASDCRAYKSRPYRFMFFKGLIYKVHSGGLMEELSGTDNGRCTLWVSDFEIEGALKEGEAKPEELFQGDWNPGSEASVDKISERYGQRCLGELTNTSQHFAWQWSGKDYRLGFEYKGRDAQLILKTPGQDPRVLERGEFTREPWQDEINQGVWCLYGIWASLIIVELGLLIRIYRRWHIGGTFLGSL